MPKKIKLKPELVEKGDSAADPFSVDGELVVDVFETATDFMVVAAIAGTQIKDIDISVEKDMMVIKGQRENPHKDGVEKYFYQECYWGPFSRKVVLPEDIDTEAADASMDKGLLVVKFPRVSDDGKGKDKEA